MADVIIFGAGGMGRMVLDTLRQARRHRPVAFLDSALELHGTAVDGLEVLGGFEQLSALHKRGVRSAIVAIGDNVTRVGLAERIVKAGFQLASAIHPLASIARTARLNQHIVVGPRACICVHAEIGAHAIISPGAIVEHDNSIGAGVFLYPAVRLAGGVTVEDGTTVGIGACVIPGRTIGRNSYVEPGSVVIRDVADNTRVGGAPAEVMPVHAPVHVDAIVAV